MKIHEILNTYYEASGKVSDLSRQLAFAGIAVIWVLKVGVSSGGIPFSDELLISMYCFVTGLALDFGQYIYKTMIYSALNWYHWKKHRINDAEVEVSPLINIPTHLMFWGKTASVGYGYIGLLFFIQAKL
jgi:hypothetical protein